jgi:hypothetical protein
MWRKTKLISKFPYKELEPFMAWFIDLGLSTAVLKYLRFHVHAEICFLFIEARYRLKLVDLLLTPPFMHTAATTISPL